MKVLIVGASGFLGTEFCRELNSMRISNVPTSRRSEIRSSISLDLLSLDRFSIPEGITHAILCSGLSGRNLELDPGLGFKTNVVGTEKLGALLFNRGIKTFFISSSAVFNSNQQFSTEIVIPEPRTIYGKQKREAEVRLSRLDKEGLLTIIRPTKILGSSSPLLRTWVDNVFNNQTIHLNRRALLAPISLRFFVRTVIAFMSEGRTTLIHISGDRLINYEYFAMRFFQIAHGVIPFENIHTYEEDSPDSASVLDNLTTTYDSERTKQNLESFFKDL